jgi:hypothetical protein
MSKVEFELESLSDEFVFGKLLAMVGSERVYLVLDGSEELAEALAHGAGGSPRHLPKQREARLSLGQGEHGVLLLFTQERVHFPVAQTLPGLHHGGAFLDGAAIGQFAPAIIVSIAFPTLFLATQVLVRLPPSRLSSRIC